MTGSVHGLMMSEAGMASPVSGAALALGAAGTLIAGKSVLGSVEPSLNVEKCT